MRRRASALLFGGSGLTAPYPASVDDAARRILDLCAADLDAPPRGVSAGETSHPRGVLNVRQELAGAVHDQRPAIMIIKKLDHVRRKLH